MWRLSQTCVFVAFSCLLLLVETRAQFPLAVTSAASCSANYNLSSLANETVASHEVQSPGGRRPLTVLTILEATFQSSSRQETANRLNISIGCLEYLELSLPEISLFLLNTSEINKVTFDDVFRGVFASEVESVLRSMVALKLYIQRLNLAGNETLHEFAVANNLSLESEPILDILLQPFNVSDIRILSLFLEVNLTNFELLNRTTRELAEILAVENPDELKNYTLLHLVKISYVAREFVSSGLLMTIQKVRASLHVKWIEIVQEVENVTSVLEVVLLKVSIRVYHLRSYVIGAIGYDLSLLNVTLQEISELTNKTVMELQNYKVYPQLVSFIIKTRKKIVDINGETKKEISYAIKEILEAYNVTIFQLGEAFNLTRVQISKLSPLKIEVFSARITLIRYVTNLNLTLAEVAVKVNRTEAELSYNLTVKDFHVVIRKLMIVRTFEVMSQMLGVSQHFLVNSLNITVPVSSLSMCQLDTFLKVKRYIVLSLREVITKKSLAFVVQINGFSITFVYKLTIQQFIIRVMRLSVREFFALNGLNYTYPPSRLEILVKYNFAGLNRLFHINKDIPDWPFAIFRYSVAWIINRIFFLVETDKDECDLRTDRCHRLSECINLPGTYECICPPRGYSGKYCEDINECKEGSAVCPMDAHCVNTPGSYRCACNTGFRHNATNNTCDDIDECENIFDNNCYWGGLKCINTVGSYVCRCDEGYRYDYRYLRCRDINECKEDRYKCSRIDANAECKNTRGSYECSCRRGFEPYYNESVPPRVLVNCTDIDECARGQEVCPRYSECVNTMGGAFCRCYPGYEWKNGRCRAKRFVPFIWLWVRYIRKSKCEKISLSTGFPYFGKLHKKIYICHNGLISIGKKYYRANPRRLTSLRKDIIAVFWANTDITVFSKISYQVVDRSTPEFREQLDNVSDVIRNCSGASDFNATWMLIVRWENVAPYARFFSINPYTLEQSTYQVILVTNGTASYAVYIYADGGMLWTRRLRRRCAVGYSTKNGVNSYEEDDSFGENIFSIDSKEFDVNGVKRRGFFCKSLNTPSAPVVLTKEQRCMNWYNEEPDPDLWLEELSDCPPTRRAARRDNRYRRVSRSRDVYCYELRFPTRIYGASHQCCYFRRGRRNNAFVSEPPRAGRAYRYHYRNRLRQQSDINPFQVCCSEAESDLCSLFYEKRPLTTAASVPEFSLPCACRFLAFGCSSRSRCNRRRRRRRFRRFRIAWFFGDPHISTLDGQQFTFNGLGDYVLTRTQDYTFHIHGRTKRPRTSGGELSNATVFSGFALKAKTSDTVQILFDASLQGNLSITVKQQADSSCTNHTIEYFDEARDFVGMSIERSSVNNKSIIVSFPSGFSIEVTPGIELLQITVSADEDLMNSTRGLLGNFNGNKTDDLQYPNGTTISVNATEEEIYDLGQKWRVPYAERLFVWSSNCTRQNVFFDEAFVPSFLNMSAVTPEIRALCGDNRECIYDVLTTGNRELGKETAGFEEENQNLVNELANTPPEISGPTEVNVTLNQQTEFYITAKDADNDTVTLDIEDLPPGASFDNATGHFVWTPVNATNVTLEFIATDSKNASTVLAVVVNMCQCQNNGECDFTEFVGDNTGPFRVVACNCTDEFEGTFCETEILDACADDPCYENVTCNTTRNPYGFRCGPCPAGLTGDGQSCFEIDECANTSLSRCNQTCINTVGSFRCECHHGFIAHEQGRICRDINECQEAGNMRHNCTENASCMNLPGSFNCSCNSGFEGDPYSNCTDKNECTNGDALCSQGCDNTPGSFMCTCRSGFRLSSNQATCEDINECTSGHNCERICENVIGSYKCKCPAGLELNADNVTCKVAEGSECDSTKGGCSQLCVNRTGLITCFCEPGFNLIADGKNCSDINECMTGSHGCSQKCSNTEGSYTCACHPGYKLAEDGKTCTDVNECSTLVLNNCSQMCENSEGSFQCSCEDGFSIEPDNATCKDIDECSSAPSNCTAGSCVNIPGSFQCQCPTPLFYSFGGCRGTRVFAISLTLKSLNGVPVVWLESYLDKASLSFGFLARRIEKQVNRFFSEGKFRGRFLRCSVRRFRQGSVVADVDLNFAGNATDVSVDGLNNELPPGGQMGNLIYDPNPAKVSDFDECADKATHTCHVHATCVNTPGSFDCKCKNGYQGDGINKCDAAPGPADSDDDDKKKLAIILGAVFSSLVLIILVAVCCACRNKRYKAEIEEPKGSIHMTSRSVRSDVYFAEDEEKKTRTGSYDVNPQPVNGDGEGSRSRGSSGDYDFPDPYPGGKRTTHYDNPGLQKDAAL